MLAKSSSSLVFASVDRTLVGYNFLQKSTFECSVDLFGLLHKYGDWRTVGAGESDEINPVIEVGALVDKADPIGLLEEEFNTCWRWGIPAAMFHFSVQGNDYLTIEMGEKKQLEMAAHTPSPPLFLDNSVFEHQVSLPTVSDENELLTLMSRRRTIREVADIPVGLETLADILFSGMGITGKARNCVGELPLGMTPSGGARNPYEAYVFVRQVSGIAPGIYHYSATDHSLGKLDAPPPDRLSTILGGQDWVDNMACVIVLCAFLDRTMWKYDDPNAYRVVLIEAGHIGQNMMLTGTLSGLTVCPSAALSHELLFEALELPSKITCAPIYGLAIGSPEKGLFPSAFDGH